MKYESIELGNCSWGGECEKGGDSGGIILGWFVGNLVDYRDSKNACTNMCPMDVATEFRV